jgi:hypothetical protein
MTDRPFDPTVQAERDGPLTEPFKQRLQAQKVRFDLNYGNIAFPTEIAASTLATIMRGGRVRTAVAKRLARTVENLEAALDGRWRDAVRWKDHGPTPFAKAPSMPVDGAATETFAADGEPPNSPAILHALETLRQSGFSVRLDYVGPQRKET